MEKKYELYVHNFRIPNWSFGNPISFLELQKWIIVQMVKLSFEKLFWSSQKSFGIGSSEVQVISSLFQLWKRAIFLDQLDQKLFDFYIRCWLCSY